MTNTEYLESLEELEKNIESQKLYIQELKYALSGLDAIRYDKDRVQSSPEENPMLNQMIKIEDEETKLKKMIHQFVCRKCDCINMIHQLHDINHQKLLYLLYIDKKTMAIASKELNYSYEYIRKLHRLALKKLDTQCHKTLVV